MTTISKNARKSATALLFGMIALTGVTAQAMDESKIDALLRDDEAHVKVIDIMNRCLEAEKAKGTHSEAANRGLQDCKRAAFGIPGTLSYSRLYVSRIKALKDEQFGWKCVARLTDAKASGKYNDRLALLEAFIRNCQELVRISQGTRDILEEPEDKK